MRAPFCDDAVKSIQAQSRGHLIENPSKKLANRSCEIKTACGRAFLTAHDAEEAGLARLSNLLGAGMRPRVALIRSGAGFHDFVDGGPCLCCCLGTHGFHLLLEGMDGVVIGLDELLCFFNGDGIGFDFGQGGHGHVVKGACF